MKRLIRMLCVLLCLTFLPIPALAEESAPTIRVMLRRLNLTNRADLTLDGLYTAAIGKNAAMSFPKGSQVSVEIRDNQLYLFYQGMSMLVGSSLNLIRNASPYQDTEGIRFVEGGNFYPGDLSLTIQDGVLQPVLTISVEDYLLGVVPYEMSNYFPVEALKAQAVCARTYALAHVNKSAAYDVVDTTNDQVFKGVDRSYTNAVRAVEETAGVVGTYKGKLANCYYSASNGGQTELVQNVWSDRSERGYYAIVDDPYDLQNPESIVREAKLPKEGGVSSAFTEVLASALAKQMKKEGFDQGGDCLRIDSISAMSLGGRKYAEPSRFMTKLTLTFTWSGRNRLEQPASTTLDTEISLFATASPTPDVTPAPTAAPGAPTPTPQVAYSPFRQVEEPTTLTIDLFPDAVRALDLSVYGADNEMITITETNDHFILEARRYGHGVGMSQRGAQWMAFMYGKTYQEILDFYYPGMELKTMAAGDAVLPSIQPQLAQTISPPATPTPRPTLMPVTAADLPEGAYLASVEGIADDSSLNLRESPSTAAAILMRLYKHQQLMVLETCENPEWVKVKTDVIEGYVMLSYLAPVE